MWENDEAFTVYDGKNPITKHFRDLVMMLHANLDFDFGANVMPKAANLHQVLHPGNISLRLLLQGEARSVRKRTGIKVL